MFKYHKVSEEDFNVTSTNRDFRIKQLAVARCEETKEGLSDLISKQIVQQDGIHFLLLNI